MKSDDEVYKFAKDMATACRRIGSSHIFFILQQAFDKKGLMSWGMMEEKLDRIIKLCKQKNGHCVKK